MDDPNVVSTYITGSPNLAPIIDTFPHFIAFMLQICRDDILQRKGSSVQTSLALLTQDDSVKIAKLLGASVRENLTPAAGVAQWKDRVPAMQVRRRDQAVPAGMTDSEQFVSVMPFVYHSRLVAPPCSLVRVCARAIAIFACIHAPLARHPPISFASHLPRLQELLNTHLFLEPTLVIVMQHSLVSHPIGLYLRVFKLTCVSMLDMVTDIIVITEYMSDEETRGYGRSLLAMVVGCLLFQALVVVAQNMKKPRKIPLELIYILTGMGPGVAAYRVCVGKEMDEYAAVDDKMLFSECRYVCFPISLVVLTRPHHFSHDEVY